MSFVPLTTAEQASMLEALGLTSVESLFDAIPAERRGGTVDIGSALAEVDVVRRVGGLAKRNRAATDGPCFLGAGAYQHFVPAAVGAILGRSEFATSYTPYQPEVSQGTLQASFEFQSLVCALTAMDVSNASVYDGASAMAEAALMALRLTGRHKIVVSGGVHPHYRQVLATYLGPRAVEIVTTRVGRARGADGRELIVEADIAAILDDQVAACIVAQPTFFGEIRDLGSVVERAHAVGALAVEVYNPTSLGLLRPPGEWGVDIAAAEGQCLGIALSYGGPYVGLLTCRRDLVRQMPGRIVGQTSDGQGRRGYVLTLQAREQHIRREKATSNICTSQTLIALGVTTYLALLGPDGLRSVADACWRLANHAAESLAAIEGVEVLTPAPRFHEFVIRTPVPAAQANQRLLEYGIIGGYDLGKSYPGFEDALLFCCTELTTREDIDALATALRSILHPGLEQPVGVGALS